MLDKSLSGGLLINNVAVPSEEAYVLLDKGLLSEPRGHRGILNGLHLDRVRSAIPLQLPDEQASFSVDAKDVEPVHLTITSRRPPTVKLERNNKNIWPED